MNYKSEPLILKLRRVERIDFVFLNGGAKVQKDFLTDVYSKFFEVDFSIESRIFNYNSRIFHPNCTKKQKKC